jgi:Co/Zn/Cd efflux system component
VQWALGLNAGFMIAEFVGAAMSGSLALAADAVHI